jgi:NADH:ubiquinone oxidoreductase subunit 2 (subunit N)
MHRSVSSIRSSVSIISVISVSFKIVVLGRSWSRKTTHSVFKFLAIITMSITVHAIITQQVKRIIIRRTLQAHPFLIV